MPREISRLNPLYIIKIRYVNAILFNLKDSGGRRNGQQVIGHDGEGVPAHGWGCSGFVGADRASPPSAVRLRQVFDVG